MTTEVPQSPRRHRGLSAAVAESLRQLPSRRPAEPAAPTSALQWNLVDLERYEITTGNRTLGYIDVVGAVFVVLLGSRYDRALEVTQTLVFEAALDVFRQSVAGRASSARER